MAEIENPINLVIIIIGAFLGITLGLFLLLNKSIKNRANLFLGILVLILSSYFITGFQYRFHLFEAFPHTIGIANFLTFLIGPLTYFYIQACTQKNKWQAKDSLHFIPFAIDFLINLPLIIKSGPEKIARYEMLLTEGDLHQIGWLLVLKSLHGLFYFGLSIRLVLQYRKHLSNTASSIDTAFHRWTLLFIGMLALPISAMLGYVYFDYERVFMLIALLCFFSFILAVYFAALFKPELFHAFPNQMPALEHSEVQKQKYESSNLQETQKEQYISKLKAFVELKKPFQSPDLTLKELAEQVKIPAHYLSQVINEKLDTNFIDFINSYRVKAAQEMLVDPKLSHYTIVSIAYETGFSAKSTFYAVFKKHTGMTPSAYRKQKIAT